MKGQEFIDILIVAVTVIVVAIPGMCWLRSDTLWRSELTRLRGTSLSCYSRARICDCTHAQRK
jgi:hypothetical protein